MHFKIPESAGDPAGDLQTAGERLDDTKMVSVLGKEKRSVAFYSPHQEFSQMYLAMGYAKICAAKSGCCT